MTVPEQIEEANYRIEERLGILAGADMATGEQRRLAQGEANQAVNEIEAQEKRERELF